MAPPAIEVLHSESYMPSKEDIDKGGQQHYDDNSNQAASLNDDEEGGAQVLIVRPMYGFNRQYSTVFQHLKEEIVEVVRLPDPEGTPETKRTQVSWSIIFEGLTYVCLILCFFCSSFAHCQKTYTAERRGRRGRFRWRHIPGESMRSSRRSVI